MRARAAAAARAARAQLRQRRPPYYMGQQLALLLRMRDMRVAMLLVLAAAVTNVRAALGSAAVPAVYGLNATALILVRQLVGPGPRPANIPKS